MRSGDSCAAVTAVQRDNCAAVDIMSAVLVGGGRCVCQLGAAAALIECHQGVTSSVTHCVTLEGC